MVPLFPMLSLCISVIAHPFSPAAIFDWCDFLPKTFDLKWFPAVFHTFKFQRRQHSTWERMAVLSSYSLRAVHSGHLSVATKHTGHDRFIASCGAIPSQIPPPLFTELRTNCMTPQPARRSIRVLITRHTGVGRNFPCPIKHRVQILKNLPCFIAYFYADCQGTKRTKVSVCVSSGLTVAVTWVAVSMT